MRAISSAAPSIFVNMRRSGAGVPGGSLASTTPIAALIAISGVRRSCEALAKNSSRCRSRSRCAVTSRSVSTAPSRCPSSASTGTALPCTIVVAPPARGIVHSSLDSSPRRATGGTRSGCSFGRKWLACATSCSGQGELAGIGARSVPEAEEPIARRVGEGDPPAGSAISTPSAIWPRMAARSLASRSASARAARSRASRCCRSSSARWRSTA